MKLTLSAIALLASSASAFNAFSPKKAAAPAAVAAPVSLHRVSYRLTVIDDKILTFCLTFTVVLR
jgi:hypothetical protein